MPLTNFSVNGFFNTARAVLHHPDEVRPTPGPLTPAAVLVPVTDRGETSGVLLTRRPDTMPDHAGQISFPGGKIDPGDKDPLSAALRETEEELGLHPDFIEILGCLPVHDTATGFSIVPVVGRVKPGYSLSPCDTEVDEVFEAPLDFVMTPEHYTWHEILWRGRIRRYQAVSYRHYFIWGATAAVLVNLRKHVYG